MMKEVWRLQKNEKVAAIDIDGILTDYPFCWVDFINKTLKKKFKDLTEVKKGLSFFEYKRLKIIYRTQGFKKNLPAMKGATEFVKRLQKKGFKVILLSARPVIQHREIQNDTLEWLKKNDINPDAIIWDKDKHWAVLKEFPYLSFMVEDNAEIANQVARINYKVYVLDNPYNQQPLAPYAQRVFSLEDILRCELVR